MRSTPQSRLPRPPLTGLVLAGLLTTAAPAAAADVLLLRDGGRAVGELIACAGDICRLDANEMSRATIRWIGFATDESAAPSPPPVDPSRDEVRLRDGTIHVGRVAGLSLGSVASQAGVFDRPSVAWIYFGSGDPVDGPPPETGDTTGGGSSTEEPPADDGDVEEPPEDDDPPPPEDEPPPDEEPPPEEDPPPDAPREPLPPHPELLRPCPPERPLGGHIEIDWSIHSSFTCDRPNHIEYRFTLVPTVGRPWPRELYDGYNADVVDYEFRASACHDTDEPGVVCRDAGGSSRGSVRLGRLVERGDARVYEADGNLGGIFFDALAPRLFFTYIVPAIDTSGTCTAQGVTYEFGDHVSSIDLAIAPDDCGRHPPGSFCHRPTLCEDPPPERRDECNDHPDRYAALPFVGSVRAPSEMLGHYAARYRICCGCAERPAPPPDAESDPCGDLDAQRGLLEVLRAERQALVEELIAGWAELDAEQEGMEALRGEFEHAMRECTLWNAAEKLMAFLVKRGGDPGKAILKLKSILDRMAAGNPTWLIVVEDPVTGVRDDLSPAALNAAWKYVMNQLAQLGESQPETLRRKLDACAGKIQLDDVYRDAQKFLDHFARASTMLSGLQQTMNQVAQKDLDIWNAEHDLHRRCLEWAECKGLPPSVCDPPPPAAPPE